MIKKVFVRGLFTITPIAITIAIVIWLFDTVDNFFSQLFIDVFGPKYYFPGLGFLLAIIVIFIIGVLMSNWLVKKAHELFEKIMNKMPLVKTIYQSMVDLISFFKSDNKSKNSSVVVVKFGAVKILGLVSRETFDDLPKGIGVDGEVAVYIPMSYQIGGVTVMVPMSMVEKIDMSLEDGLRFAATAGMPGQQKEDEQNEGENK
ncbi:MAG: hypothetical protein S4CHLAM6_08090 [Chlamydiae bacterium]|nr:hypothetical protein [Chlamydiota bacterium]